MKTIGFIGCGNMGGAIARAVCKAAGPQAVFLANRTPAKAQALAAQLGCHTAANAEVAASCDLIFLGVKPQMMSAMLADVAPVLKKRAEGCSRFVLATMAAGLSMARIREMAGGAYPVIRIMPNTPASIGAGMIQYCTLDVTDEEKAEFAAWMAPAGRLDALDESLIDAASCVSGCGPAWAYQFIEALADGGVACGLPRAKAIEYAAQMLAGSAQLVLESGQHPGALKDAVCSPGGSTIQGVRVLEERAFRGAVTDAVITAYEKTKDMGKAK
jgi:pyrroline-5-carboxylate reductase